jgi:S-formylglutathione hydrolase FrmB
MVEQFTTGGQQGWLHDRGHWGGYFHTYERFQVGEWDKPRKIHIFLPRDYDVSQDRYPVIYTNDGNTVFFPGGAYKKTWDLATTISRLYLSDRICRVIVVAVCPLNRDYEYTHAPVKGSDWGGLDNYAHYLARSLKSFIDSHYRTIHDAEKTLVLGSSHGGLAAFYTATKHPHEFRCVAALSPSFWVGLDMPQEDSINAFADDFSFMGSLNSSALLFEASQTLKDGDRRLKIYLDWGLVREGGFHNSFIEERATARGREMRDILIKDFGYQENKSLFVVEDPSGEHNEESWSKRVENVLEIFYKV